MEEEKKNLSTAALIVGIVAVLLSLRYILLGIATGIVGIVISVNARKNEPAGNNMATAGMICSIVATVIAGIRFLALIAFTMILGAGLALL